MWQSSGGMGAGLSPGLTEWGWLLLLGAGTLLHAESGSGTGTYEMLLCQELPRNCLERALYILC